MRLSSWSAGAHEGVLFQNTGPLGLRRKERAAGKTSDKEGVLTVGQIGKIKRYAIGNYPLITSRSPARSPRATQNYALQYASSTCHSDSAECDYYSQAPS